jgi:ABC-2 type transport system ATP-binding protein
VSIIRQGRNVETGTLAEMRHVTYTTVDVTLDSVPQPSVLAGASAVQIDGTRVRCDVPTEQIGALLAQLEPYGIRALTCQPPTLEQLFLRHYDRELTPATIAAGTRE